MIERPLTEKATGYVRLYSREQAGFLKNAPVREVVEELIRVGDLRSDGSRLVVDEEVAQARGGKYLEFDYS